MNQKELTKTFMMIINLKNTLVVMFFQINSVLYWLNIRLFFYFHMQMQCPYKLSDYPQLIHSIYRMQYIVETNKMIKWPVDTYMY